MKLPLSWIKEYVDSSLSTTEIADKLTKAGLEVEAIESRGEHLKDIVVAKVLSTEAHPNSDRLCIAQVDDGSEVLQIVCGASNCRKGLLTALARIGSSLKDSEGKKFKIKKSKLRGVESFGMLCSSQELKLCGSEEGIMELDENHALGTPLSDIFLEEILEIALTPNLVHCANVLGVARELGALVNNPIKKPRITCDESAESIADQARVTVDDFEKCPRYLTRIIKDVQIGPSPKWMQQRLEDSGIRSINNIVDTTNYVLLEYGHPLHAFDHDLIEGKHIIVKTAQKNQNFTTLDGTERQLDSDTLLICDEKKPIALAGIMGGKNSEVHDKTKNILLESAYFLPGNIRKTSKMLNLQTESSWRFERGADPNCALTALERAAQLMQSLASGKVLKGYIDCKAQDTFSRNQISCRLQRVNQILGTQLSLNEAEDILKNLEFECRIKDPNVIEVKVPTFRHDIQQEIDLIEEIARIYGYDHIHQGHKTRFSPSPITHCPLYTFKQKVRQRLICEGLQEFMSCDLISSAQADSIKESGLAKDALISILNPTSRDQSILRPSLFPGLVQSVQHNISHQNYNIAAFEIGEIHLKDKGKFIEQSVAGIILSGSMQTKNWKTESVKGDFYHAKGILENLFDFLKISSISFKRSQAKHFHPGRQTNIFIQDQDVGFLAQVHPSSLRNFGISQEVIFAEINLSQMLSFLPKDARFEKLPLYPGSERDWTVTVKEKLPFQKFLEAVEKFPSKLLKKVSLKDIYRSDSIGKENKNMTLHFVYRDDKKTVSYERVEQEHQRLTSKISQELCDFIQT